MTEIKAEEGELGCIHFPGDPHAVCTLCKPRPPLDPWDGILDGATSPGVEAQFEGECVKCYGWIHVGDRIVKSGKGWRHEDCEEMG